MEALYIIFGSLVAMSLFSAFTDYFKHKAKMTALEKKVDSSEKVQFEEEIASLKHRVVTLEKIVTTKGYQVNEEIETLKSVK